MHGSQDRGSKDWKSKKESKLFLSSDCLVVAPASDRSTFWFDRMLRKVGNKERYFAADHEQTINNLRRTRFFPQPTTFNQGTHFIGLRWPPQLRLNFCTQPTSRSTKPSRLQTPIIPNILGIRRCPVPLAVVSGGGRQMYLFSHPLCGSDLQTK